jgi:hypothetical protein
MKKKSVFLTVFLLIFLLYSSAGAVTVSPFDSASNMAQNLLGSGITITDSSYTGASGASGYFTNGFASGLEMDQGILLTSGLASNVDGLSNTTGAISTNNGTSGSSLLNALIPGYSTNDAPILSIDFTTEGNAAYFNYFFGSEEYNEWVGSSFNDVFGFFMNDVNYALIPGTSTPVSINNINNGANSGYYNDNSNGVYPFEYDGFTDMFTASFTDLVPGEVYNIKLAIADAGDYALDSGVFLQGGSFSDEPGNPVPEPSTFALLGISLLGAAFISRKKLMN